MLGHIQIKERGATPRQMRKVMAAAQKEQWGATGQVFHVRLRDRRFTLAHAREAGYYRRKGEGLARGSKAYKRSYTGKKEARFGHTRPLEYTGQARRLARTAHVSATAKGVRVRYPGLRKLNWRHPKSRIQMAAEFRRVTPRERRVLAKVHDRGLDQRLAANQTTSTRTI